MARHGILVEEDSQRYCLFLLGVMNGGASTTCAVGNVCFAYHRQLVRRGSVNVVVYGLYPKTYRGSRLAFDLIEKMHWTPSFNGLGSGNYHKHMTTRRAGQDLRWEKFSR